MGHFTLKRHFCSVVLRISLLTHIVPYGNGGCSGGSIKNSIQYVIDSGGIDTERSYPYTEKVSLKQYIHGTSDSFNLVFLCIIHCFSYTCSKACVNSTQRKSEQCAQEWFGSRKGMKQNLKLLWQCLDLSVSLLMQGIPHFRYAIYYSKLY